VYEETAMAKRDCSVPTQNCLNLISSLTYARQLPQSGVTVQPLSYFSANIRAPPYGWDTSPTIWRFKVLTLRFVCLGQIRLVVCDLEESSRAVSMQTTRIQSSGQGSWPWRYVRSPLSVTHKATGVYELETWTSSLRDMDLV